MLSLAIFALAFVNYRTEFPHRHTMLVAIVFAVLTGVLVALFTTYDTWGIRATADLMTFIAWFLCSTG